ncbi:GH25 family lysozyme [Lactobacillus gasseri]|uniref:SH3b domain-containing protein n=1 Tax=Lactobacillus gasseri TaxID=1596 RepID=A0ABY3BC07_LACGS|nr:GH25 family lysozyme [Lactobacillus gasseri]MCZ3932504.1 glycoside hydrolase family 25 [Lactobacillus gasseri]MCZ3934138.1 glycoside hydrolase family 25 [Lactobacillus gasseri]MCZ3936116.1 glycoside hydrolase family 25 [Lactobacillus gasseri]MCZ3943520.1 glycoside hydrolase family 25 [Lactobacillus gasseri]MCZ3949078.1 glycoside hydrolase family 25 [Lactobacillus gasseri]
MAREIFVDLSSFQKDLTVDDYKKLGVKKAIVKISESTNYVNPYIHDLVDKSAAGGVNAFAFYHFGRFTNDAQAVNEAKYFIDNSKAKINVKPKTLMILDAEINGMPTSSVIVFLKALRDAGFRTGFYTGKNLLASFDLEAIKPYMDFFWLASYPTVAPADKNPDFNYFPSAKYVDAWQYTDNLLGMKVDGSITVTDNGNDVFNASDNANGSASSQPSKPSIKPTPAQPKTWTDVQGMTWHEEHGTFVTGGAINLRWGATTQSAIITTLPAGSEVKYNAWARDTVGRVWLQQPRSNGHDGYLVGRVGTEAWGTFK